MSEGSLSEVLPVDPSEYEVRNFMWKCCQTFARIMCRVCYDLKVRGKENFPLGGGLLVVSNHQSYLDPVLLAVMLDRPFTYLAEAYLFKFKPFAWLITALGATPVKRGKADHGAVKEVIRLVQEGRAMTIFVEGTRSRDGKLQPVQGGCAIAIRRAQVPVIPVAIAGAYDAWPRRKKLPGLGKIRVVYGKPIYLHHLKGDQIVNEIQNSIKLLFDEANEWRNARL